MIEIIKKFIKENNFDLNNDIEEIENICDQVNDENEIKAYLTYCDESSIDPSYDNYEDSRNGCYKSVAEFAEQLHTDIGSISEKSPLISHIDWQKVWDCDLRHDYNEIDFEGNIYIYRNV